MLNKKAVIVTALLLVVVVGFFIFTQCEGQKNLTIGVVLPLSGQNTEWGTNSRDAIHLAVDKYNSNGGVLGSKVVLEVLDDRSNLKEALNAATLLTKKTQVCAIIGENFSPATMAMLPPIVASGIPLISPSASNVQVTQMGKNVFRTIVTDLFQVGILAKFTKMDLAAQKVAILYNRSDGYSTGMAQNFEEVYKSYGGDIVYKGYYSAGDTDFEPQMAKIGLAAPDIVFVPENKYEVINAIMKQGSDSKMALKYLCTDGFVQLYQRVPGNIYSAVYHASSFSVDNKTQATQNFTSAYKQKYGRNPDIYAALSYDSACILLEALKTAGTTDKTLLTRAISEIGLDGVTGRMRFGQDRNPIKSMSIIKVVDGKPEFVKTVEP